MAQCRAQFVYRDGRVVFCALESPHVGHHRADSDVGGREWPQAPGEPGYARSGAIDSSQRVDGRET